MIAVVGDKTIHKKVWFYIRNMYLHKNMKIIVIDAANRFDPYLIAKICLSHNISPYIILENIIIARAFTPFQLIKLIEKVKNDKKYPFICLGINYLFEDENISQIYSWKLFKKAVLEIKSLKTISLVTANNDNYRRNFIPFLQSNSTVFVKEEKILKPILKNGENKLWEGQLHLLAQF